MVFEPVYEKANALCAKKEAPTQSVVESVFTLDNSEEILKIDSSCSVTKTEIIEGAIKVDGKVEYKVLYFDLDHNLKCENLSTDFSLKTPTSAKNAEIIVDCSVVDSGISSHNNGEIKITSVLDFSFTLLINEEVSALSPSSQGFYLKDGQERFVECKKKDKIRTEYSLNEKTLLDEVVCCSATIVITKRVPMVESVNIEGEVILENVGVKNGEIASHTITMPFTETFECEGCTYGDLLLANAYLTFCDSVIVEQEDGKKIDGIVKCTFDIGLYKESEINCAVDIFSVTHQLLPTIKNHTVCEKLGNYTVLERADGTVKLADNMPACDVILTACGNECVINSTSIEDGCVKVDGVVVGKLIYSCASPTQTVSTTLSVPFSLSLLLPVMSSDNVDIKGAVTSLVCRVRRGNEIDVKADIALDIRAFSNKEIVVISALEQGEEIITPTSAFSVYIAEGGETKWEVSAILGVSPEVISQSCANEFPLKKGDRITVYRALDSKKI